MAYAVVVDAVARPPPSEWRMITLPVPELISCYFDDGFAPRLAAMRLRWPDDEAATTTGLWHFPQNVRLLDTLPERFGVRVHRTGRDAFEVCLLWNNVSLRWANVPRAELINSSLHPVLAAIGTDLDDLLNQPVVSSAEQRNRAA
jgi:hypothetical protein